MKQSAKNAKPKKDAALQKRAENNITIVNCGIVIYALIIIMIQTMAVNTAIAEGAISFRKILIFAGIIAAMLIAAYSAYKSNKSLLKYSLMCVFVAISQWGILRCNKTNFAWGSKMTYVALALAFIFNCIYAYMTDKNLYYTAKKNQIIFKSVVCITYAILLVVLVFAYFKVI